MKRISTNLTLLLRLFLPVFWIIFFGAFTIASWTSKIRFFDTVSGKQFRIELTVFFVVGFIILYFTLMKLRRVELDDHNFYVTNYFKTARYPYENIEKVKVNDFFFFKQYSIHLKTPGYFGKKIAFIVNSKYLKDVLRNHPELREFFPTK